jgi:D-arabinose 5-phosphate isomerase GutQ
MNKMKERRSCTEERERESGKKEENERMEKNMKKDKEKVARRKRWVIVCGS